VCSAIAARIASRVTATVALGGDLAGAIERVGLDPEQAVGLVLLVVGQQVLRDLGRTAEADREHAGREGIERATVADAPHAERVLDPIDGERRRHPAGLSTIRTPCTLQRIDPRAERELAVRIHDLGPDLGHLRRERRGVHPDQHHRVVGDLRVDDLAEEAATLPLMSTVVA